MPELSNLLLFAVASLALTATPGPDMMIVAARSAAQGRSAGFATYLGVAAGSFVHALASAIGLSQLFLIVPFAYDVVRYLGAAYLAYLAYQAFRSAQPSTKPGKTPVAVSMTTMFRQGFLSNVLNPKVALFFLALFPQFIDPTVGPVWLQIFVLAIILNIVGLGVNGTVILIASRAVSSVSTSPTFEKFAHYALGTVFGGLAAKLAFEERN